MDGRRSLVFSSMDQIMPEVDRLLAGHRTLGNWSLGQICNHLAGAIQVSIEGISFRAPWLARKILGPRIKRRLLATGKMRDGFKIPEESVPRPGLDDRAEAEALRASIRLFSMHTGPVAPHPCFGEFTAEEWRRLHCIHAAHHLGFVVPEPIAVA